MKKLIISIVIVIYSIHSQAQGISATQLFCDTTYYYTDFLSNSDGTYYMVGLTYSNDGILAKFDINNQLLWRKTYAGSNEDNLRFIRRYGNDKLLLAGQTRSSDGDIPYGYTATAPTAWLLITDTFGNVLHGNVWGYGSQTDISNIDITVDGKIFVCGNTLAKNGDFSVNTSPNLVDVPYLFITDSILSKKWVKVINTQTNAGGHATRGGVYDVYNYVMPIYASDTTGDYNFVPFIGKFDQCFFYIDTNGAIFKKQRKGSIQFEGMVEMLLDNSNIVSIIDADTLAKSGDYYINEIPNTNKQSDYLSINKMDTNGTILWKHLFGAFGFPVSNNVTFGARGNIIKYNKEYWYATSIDGWDNGYIGASLGGDDIYILAWDTLGIQKRKLRFGGTGDESVAFFKEGINGKLFLGVQSRKGLIDNSLGCAIDPNHFCFSLYELSTWADGIIPSPKEENEIKLYPNPTQNTIYVEILHYKNETYALQLYSSNGNLIYETTLKNKHTALNTSTYANGQYILKVSTKHKTYTSTFIINH